jgi:hypothetical protein
MITERIRLSTLAGCEPPSLNFGSRSSRFLVVIAPPIDAETPLTFSSAAFSLNAQDRI